jgi:hypothetical protein
MPRLRHPTLIPSLSILSANSLSAMFGTCLDCVLLYRMDAPAEWRISSYFDMDLAKLVEERGAASSCIRIEPPALAAAVSTPNIGLPRRLIVDEISSAPCARGSA